MSFRTRVAMAVLLVVVAAALGHVEPAHCEIIAYEGFDYPAGSDLVGQDGGQGFAGPWHAGGFAAKTSAGTVVDDAIAYPPLATTGNAVSIPQISLINGIRRNFSSSISSGTFYVSFLLCPDGVSAREWFGLYLQGSYFGGQGQGDLYMGSCDRSFYRYGMNQRGGSGEVISSVSAVVGRTELLVLKAELQPGADVFTLYMNPTPGDPEPTSGVVKSDLDIGTVSGLVLYSFGEHDIGELRVGTTFADVTPVPEPSVLVIATVGFLFCLLARLRRG